MVKKIDENKAREQFYTLLDEEELNKFELIECFEENKSIYYKIKCKKHNEIFIKERNRFLKTLNGCKKCKKDLMGKTYTENDIKDFFKKGLNERFTLIDVFKKNKNEGKNKKTNNRWFGKFYCNKHHTYFEVEKKNPKSILGCDECIKEHSSKRNRISNEEIIEIVNKKIKELNETNKNNLELIDIFRKNGIYLIINCSEHGKTKIQKKHFLNSKYGCSLCGISASKHRKTTIGEQKIKDFLKNNKIKYQKEKTFNDLKDKSYLRYDFYLPDYNLLIEYDGEHHYKNIYHYGEENNLDRVKKHDKMKDDYAREHNIDILRIPYWERDNIEKILKEKLNIK